MLSLLARAEAIGNAQASGSGGTIQGTVADPSGASVVGADVSLTNTVSGYKQDVKSGSDGAFRLVNVPPDQYYVHIASPGFESFQQAITVRTQVPIQLKAQLALAGSKQTVEVSASTEVVENEPAAHTDVSQNLLAELPISNTGQGLSDAITLTSGGVVADSNGFFHPQGDHGETTYVVDGQPITDQQNKTFSTQLPANAFQSLELVTSSPNAEYGDKTSLVVNAVTRSGLGQPLNASFEAYYGSFGTLGENATFGIGGSKWGNFFLADTSRSGRFLDSPEFYPNHDIGNTEDFFDRVDYQPGTRDSLHLDVFAARNWFEIPNTYDQAQQDQRQQAKTLSLALGYQHTFNAQSLLSINPFFREDRVNYYPSANEFNDTPATIGQGRHLINWGTRADFSYSKGIHNIKAGVELMQYRLLENFTLGLTDPTLNPVCLTPAEGAVTTPAFTDPNACAGLGYSTNPNLSPGLIPYDLSRGGSLFHFLGAAHINEQAVYAQDSITIKNLTLNPGLRFDHYDGLSKDKLVEPRFGLSYLFKKTGTVIRGSYDRTLETPFNENLLVSSSTGGGGLASTSFGGYGAQPLRPGHRNEFDTGFQQGVGKYLRVEADYFWKFTNDAFDFDTLFNSPLAFPIEWRRSKIDGVSMRLSTSNIHGFQAYTTLGHTRARFFGPETGGLIFNSPLNVGAFRIDHDQALQQTSYLRYQYRKNGPWANFTWRFDSGEVAGKVTNLADALALTPDGQAAIGFTCGSQVASVQNPVTSCSGNYGARRLTIPSPGTFNPDHNPPRIASRNIIDIGIGSDDLFKKEKGLKTTLKFTALNVTNQAALYNFLSTFSGTHWVTPRSYQVTLGWVY